MYHSEPFIAMNISLNFDLHSEISSVFQRAQLSACNLWEFKLLKAAPEKNEILIRQNTNGRQHDDQFK